MSWQNAMLRLFLQGVFRPQTARPIDVSWVRARTSRRVWLPPVPSGWRFSKAQGTVAEPLRGEWLVRERAPDAPAARTILYLHGGGYHFCSPRTHRAISFGLAIRADADVFSLDYRLAPEHPFPAALDDTIAAWRHLLANGAHARRCVIAGDSAGGGLALATLVALRDAGDPLPAGVVTFSAWTDLATTGASMRENNGRDPMFVAEAFEHAAPLYLGATPATHPLASPVYADLHGLPPFFMLAGSTEVLRDDTLRVAARARAAGVEVECAIWPDMPHIWPIYAPFLPEASRALDEAARFVRRITGPDDTARAGAAHVGTAGAERARADGAAGVGRPGAGQSSEMSIACQASFTACSP